MLINEAMAMCSILDRYKPANIIDIGSGPRAGREVIQPHIAAVFRPFPVVWCDMQWYPGVERCDITKRGSVDRLRAKHVGEMVTALSMLEHVEDIDAAIENLWRLTSRWLLVSAPLSYPKHDYPIDNMWRPNPQELAERVGGRIVEACATAPETFMGFENAQMSIVLSAKPSGPLRHDEVPGWLTDAEAEELTRLASGRTVLEVGTYCGRSAIAMARTAKKVYCVDDYRGIGFGGGTRELAMKTFDDQEAWGRVVPLVGSQEDVLSILDLSKVDMVFYDADHSCDSTSTGIELLFRCGLRQDAVLVFHDYDETEPGVIEAVDIFRGTTGREMRNVGSLAIFAPAET